jgi:hypothetical protein
MDPHSPRFCARCGNPAPAWHRGDDALDSASTCSCGARVTNPDSSRPEDVEPANVEPPGKPHSRCSQKRAAA